ncbi:MAG: RNA polymerase sigma factor [Planctomycetota bacterium]
MSTTASDPELMHACQGGDEDAFALLVERHLDAVHAFLARRCPRWSAVEDAAQETFVRAWQARDRYAARSAVRTWLLGIAHNVLREQLGATPRHLQRLDGMLCMEGHEADDDASDEGPALAALQRCLTRLNARARRLIPARCRDCRGIKELVRAYGKESGALAREIQRLAAALRRCVEEQLP